MDKKYQVFISSTYTDLIEARDTIIKAVLAMYHIPIGMEMFSAGDDDQWTVIKSTIDVSDYYILIVGHRYGSVTDEGISYTEKEYEYARSKGIPVLAFIMNRDAKTSPAERENDPDKQIKLNQFVEKAMNNKMVNFWDTPEELAYKVSLSLIKSFTTSPRIGWVRADTTASPKVLDELADLSKENRELKAEVELLRKVNKKKPLITLDFNGEEQIELLIPGDVDFKPYPLPKSIEVVPQYLESFIDKSAVQQYNQNLSKNIEKVESYNRRLAYFAKVQAAGYELWGKLVNKGEKKGNNIYVEVTFPPEVRVIKGAKKDIPTPKIPDLPVHPVKAAEKKHKYSQLNAAERLVQSINANRNRSTDTFSSLYNVATNLPPIEEYSQLKSNTITIHLDDLLHTRSIEFEPYTIVPGRVGEYEVKVSIICEEYSEPQIHTIPLIVRD